MLTIGQLARRCNLSRSALLYYDRIGLLCPSGRTSSGYRLYSDADVQRMDRIIVFRQAGIALAEIREILDAGEVGLVSVLEARLTKINQELGLLHRQQHFIAGLLKDRAVLAQAGKLDKQGWVEILRASGLDEEDMANWHAQFERLNPHAHRDFLVSLGISKTEIDKIRGAARAGSLPR